MLTVSISIKDMLISLGHNYTVSRSALQRSVRTLALNKSRYLLTQHTQNKY